MRAGGGGGGGGGGFLPDFKMKLSLCRVDRYLTETWRANFCQGEPTQ